MANKAKTIKYSYDAAGQRIGKQVEKWGAAAGDATTTFYTWYVRDASGNVMGTYTSNAATSDGTLTVDERHLYGSSRLGMYAQGADAKILPSGAAVNAITGNFMRGNKFFELSNHLGNVLATISERKIAVDDGTYQFGEEETGPQGQPGVLFVVKTSNLSDGVLDYYTADVVTANDYYPFGMVMPGRKYNNGSKYRYGFQNQENEGEIYPNCVAFKFRIADTRIGRFLSVDPLLKDYPHNSPYAFSENNVLDAIEVEGLEAQKLIGLFSIAQKGLEFSIRSTNNAIQTTTSKKIRLQLHTQLVALKSDYAKVMIVIYKLQRTVDTDVERILDVMYENKEAINAAMNILDELSGSADAREAFTGKDRDGKDVGTIGRLKSFGSLIVTFTPAKILRILKKANRGFKAVRKVEQAANLVWNLGEAVVTKLHHNWSKIFGTAKVTLADVELIVKEAVDKGTWKTVDVIRGKGGKIIGDKLEIVQNVKGNNIWVGAMKEHSTGKIIINNAAVQ